MTKKLFHHDSYQVDFQAKIVDKYMDNGKYVLLINQTYFYPNAGGQTCDRGTINGIPVVEVQEVDGNILHYLPGEINANAGETVSGKIDWKERFDHMQQHTGQHILSGALMDLWQKETLSFHMGEENCTLDIPFTSLDNDRVEILERMVNRIIFENRPIHHYYAEDNHIIAKKGLRKFQKLSEKLRIVDIDKFDVTACGGTHCHFTGEVGMIKITGWENRKDKTRISFLCGYRALADYQQKHLVTKNLSNMLTTGVNQLEEKIIQLNREQKQLSKECSRIEKRLLQFEVEELKESNGMEQKGLFIVSKLFSEKSLQSLKQIALILSNQKKSLVILGAENPEPAICLSCSQDLSFSMGGLMKKIMAEYNGKGGGSDFMAMGKLAKSDDIRKVFKRTNDLLLQSL